MGLLHGSLDQGAKLSGRMAFQLLFVDMIRLVNMCSDVCALVYLPLGQILSLIFAGVVY